MKFVSRLERGHCGDCVARAKRAGWGSPWWIHSLEYRSATGRKHRRMRRQFLRLQCLFTECKAVLLIDAIGAADMLAKRAAAPAPSGQEP